MILLHISNLYNLLLGLGAFYLGTRMYKGSGDFEAIPHEWIGILPIDNWATIGLFGIVVFGIGNTMVSLYGMLKQTKVIYTMTFIMGALLFLSTIIPTKLLGEWYLPTSELVLLSIIQLSFGFFGIIKHIKKKRSVAA